MKSALSYKWIPSKNKNEKFMGQEISKITGDTSAIVPLLSDEKSAIFSEPVQMEKFSYDNVLPKYFATATIFWGVVGMLAGVLIAFSARI